MRRFWILAAGLGVPAAFVYLYAFNPEGEMPFPPCWFHRVTGLHCPGCGATRCVHALLHGDLAQAAAFNVLFLVLLPFIVWWGIRSAVCLWRGQPIPTRRLPSWAWFCIAIGIVVYGVLRNLLLEPFSLLAPHQL